MASSRFTNSSVSPEELRSEWIEQLRKLMAAVNEWARDLGWDTREIEKRMDDSEIGVYQAPSLLLQNETSRVLLDPVARTAPGAEGVVDLYLLPAYDDIASLFLVKGDWQMHYVFRNQQAVAAIREPELMPVSREAFARVLEAMKANAI